MSNYLTTEIPEALLTDYSSDHIIWEAGSTVAEKTLTSKMYCLYSYLGPVVKVPLVKLVVKQAFITAEGIAKDK
jgi:hypothetical protein